MSMSSSGLCRQRVPFRPVEFLRHVHRSSHSTAHPRPGCPCANLDHPHGDCGKMSLIPRGGSCGQRGGASPVDGSLGIS